MLERDKVLEAMKAMHARGQEWVSLVEVQEFLRGKVNSNTVSGQIHYLHRRSGQIEAAPSKRPQGQGGRPVTVYRFVVVTGRSRNDALRADLHRQMANELRQLARIHDAFAQIT